MERRQKTLFRDLLVALTLVSLFSCGKVPEASVSTDLPSELPTQPIAEVTSVPQFNVPPSARAASLPVYRGINGQ